MWVVNLVYPVKVPIVLVIYDARVISTYSSGQKNVAVSAAVHPVCTFAKQSTNGLQTQTSAVRSVPFRSVSFPAVVQQAQY